MTRLLVGSGGGTIDASVAGLLLFDRVEIESLVWSGGRNGTIRDCFGLFGITTLNVQGAIDHFENTSEPVNSIELARELCYGPGGRRLLQRASPKHNSSPHRTSPLHWAV